MEQISIDNLEDWPKDWDLHIVKAFSSYLPDNDGSRDVSFEAATFHVDRFVSADYDIDKSTVSIVFKFKDKRWSGNFSYDESIFCELFYVVAIVPVKNSSQESFRAYPSGKAHTLIKSPLCSLVSNSLLDLITEVQEAIRDDYWRRGNGGEDDLPPEPQPLSPDSHLLPLPQLLLI